jgi:hypothetical protein
VHKDVQSYLVCLLGSCFLQTAIVFLELAKDGKYVITVLTRDATYPSTKVLEDIGNVKLVQGSFQQEKTLREAMKGQYGLWLNLDSFSMTEGEFYFWAFRM